MVAIAGGESGWIPWAAGEPLSRFSPADQLLYAPYDCNGYLSWGLWQIFVGVHHGKLQTLTGSTDPCVWRDYLFDPGQNAAVARMVWGEQGFAAWTIYNLDLHLAFLEQAELAVDAALGPPIPPVIVLPAAREPPLQAATPPASAVAPPASI